jgi:hypothetical protein
MDSDIKYGQSTSSVEPSLTSSLASLCGLQWAIDIIVVEPEADIATEIAYTIPARIVTHNCIYQIHQRFLNQFPQYTLVLIAYLHHTANTAHGRQLYPKSRPTGRLWKPSEFASLEGKRRMNSVSASRCWESCLVSSTILTTPILEAPLICVSACFDTIFPSKGASCFKQTQLAT